MVAHRLKQSAFSSDALKQPFEKATKHFGYFVLVSNEALEAEEALRLYREREKIEEMFNIQKNALDGKRPGV